MSQTYQDWELIVLDNSDEPISFTTDDPRIKWFYEPDITGVADAYNRCLSKATGDVMHPLSDDDRLAKRALETVARELGESEWLYARTVVNNQDGEPQFILGDKWDLEKLREGYYLGGAVYWRKWMSEDIGGFNTGFDGAADYDLYLRFGETVAPKFIKDILYLYTDHPGTDSHVRQQNQIEKTLEIANR